MNDTITNFGHPQTLIGESDAWVVLLRPQQATLGALVLACKEDVLALHDVSAAALAEMPTMMSRCEALLQDAFGYDKINHLMLMMVDPHVHYHVLPRYAEPRRCNVPALADVVFEDAGWPALPRLDAPTALDDEQRLALTAMLRERWQTLGS